MANAFPTSWVAKSHRFSDEIFTAAHGLLSYHFLSQFGGLVTEIFYGLERSHKMTVSSSLAVHVLLPYIKLKMERLYKNWIIMNQKEPSDPLYELVRILTPALNLGYVLFNLAIGLLYVSGKAK